MAKLLYRLGITSSKHPWTVLISWLVLLALGIGSYLIFGGSLQSAITIPGTPTTQVTDQLSEEFPEAANGTGGIIFRTTDGSAFTEEQQEAITDLLAEVEELDGVEQIVDPFATTADIEQQVQELQLAQEQLNSGSDQIEAAAAQLEESAVQLETARAELEAGQQQLDAGVAAMVAQGLPQEMAEQQVAAQQQQLDEALAQVEAGQAELEAGQQELEATRAEAEAGAETIQLAYRMLELSSDYRVVNEDGSVAEATLMYAMPSLDVTPDVQDLVVNALETAQIDGVDVLPSQEISQGIPQIIGPAEIVGLVIAAIVLVIMLGTFITAGLPILNALIGVGVGVTFALAFSSVVDMNSISPVLGIMLGLAVGIDYALFIVNRHRQQLKSGMDVRTSIGLANGTSGNAVVFAGSTVVIALLALNITGIPLLGIMGTVGAVCVAIAVLVAITLTPAMLSWIGIRALSKKERTKLAETQAASAAVEAGAADTKETKPVKPMSWTRAIVTAVVSIAALLVIAIPALDMRLGLPDASAESPDTSAHQAYMTRADEFGEGRNAPLVVVAEYPEGAIEEVADQAGAISPQIVELAEQLSEVENVSVVVPVGTSDDNTVVVLQVVPEEGPNAVSTENLVHELRTMDPAGDAESLGVAGMTSGFIDVSDVLADALPVYLAVVVGLSLIIMIIVFRSLLVPLIATGGFILSVFAAMGGVVAIYQWGWLGSIFQVYNPAPVLSFLPTILVGVLFGLAMDYQLFISTGMREAYARGMDARTAVMAGFRNGRTVVIAAAIIMVSVFGGFIFSDSALIRPIGFALAFGVALDAFVVRLLLVPALMHLVGKGAWWLPKWLDKIIPNVDVEGSQLEAEVEKSRQEAPAEKESVTN